MFRVVQRAEGHPKPRKIVVKGDGESLEVAEGCCAHGGENNDDGDGAGGTTAPGMFAPIVEASQAKEITQSMIRRRPPGAAALYRSLRILMQVSVGQSWRM